MENFPVSGERVPVPVVRWLGRIKAAAARVNAELGLLDAELAERIARAGDEVAEGEHDDQFPIDVFQTGSGTSSNMNANEVIANLAGEGVHPNDHVNMGQSSNDVFPSAVHLAAVDAVQTELLPALERLAGSLRASRRTSSPTWSRPGRTHMMDAVPVTLGQEFGGYAAQITLGRDRVRDALGRAAQIPLGGTATGTGLNTHPEFAERVRERLGLGEAPLDRFEAQANRDGLVELHGALKVRGRVAHQDRQRPGADGLGTAHRARGAPAARATEGLVDHARQGQPGDPRGRAAGGRAGDRQRHRRYGRRHARAPSS